MFLLQNAFRQRVLVIGIEHGNGLLHDDGSVVEFFIHKMHRATGHFYAVGEGLLLRLQSGKRGKREMGGYSGCDAEIAVRTRAKADACIRPGRPDRPYVREVRRPLRDRAVPLLALRRNQQRILALAAGLFEAQPHRRDSKSPPQSALPEFAPHRHCQRSPQSSTRAQREDCQGFSFATARKHHSVLSASNESARPLRNL